METKRRVEAFEVSTGKPMYFVLPFWTDWKLGAKYFVRVSNALCKKQGLDLRFTYKDD